jgi:hypothetical protein
VTTADNEATDMGCERGREAIDDPDDAVRYTPSAVDRRYRIDIGRQ